MTRLIPGPYPPGEMARFLDTFFYTPEAFLVDEVLRLDPDKLEARMDTTKPLPVTVYQRHPSHYPSHVAGSDILLLTGTLGCLHAYFLHGCRWDEGWVACGNHIHAANFRSLVHVGPLLELRSTKTRKSPQRLVSCYEFSFTQEGRTVCEGEQSAQFFRVGGPERAKPNPYG